MRKPCESCNGTGMGADPWLGCSVCGGFGLYWEEEPLPLGIFPARPCCIAPEVCPECECFGPGGLADMLVWQAGCFDCEDDAFYSTPDEANGWAQFHGEDTGHTGAWCGTEQAINPNIRRQWENWVRNKNKDA